MTWNPSGWAVRNPLPPILLCVLLCAAGTFSFFTLPITRYPNIDKPIISIVIGDGGVAPTELEAQVTRKVEDAISAVAGIRHVTSTISDGSSSTSIEFRIGVDISSALNDVKNAVARVRSTLPAGVDEPIVERNDVQSRPLRTYSVTAANMTPQVLSWFVDNTAMRDLQGLQGVGRVARVGGVDREIQIRLDPDKLMALGVSAAAITQQLFLTNVNVPGGKSEIGGEQQFVRTLASALTLKDLADLRVDLSDGRKARLGDIATVSDAAAEQTSFASLNMG